MGKNSTARVAKRVRGSNSGVSTPESRSAEQTEKPTADDKSEHSSQEDEDEQGDILRAGEQVLSLLRKVDQKTLIALLQALLCSMTRCQRMLIARRAWRMWSRKTIYRLLARDSRDMWDKACAASYTGYPSGPSCSRLLTLPPKPSLLSMQIRTSTF